MKTLKVIMPFRDISDFSVRHEAGDVITVADTDRATRLVQGGLCEEVPDKPAPRPSPKPAPEPSPAPVAEEDSDETPSPDPNPVSGSEDAEGEESGGDNASGTDEDEGDGEDKASESTEKPAAKKGRKSTKK